jgi:hypothetical protein
MRLQRIVIPLALALLTAVGEAQRPTTAPPAAARLAPRTDSLVISLLTFGPGAQLFDRFGHTAIRVRDGAGLDSAWNWGMYDFNAPNFITRFLTGDTQYWMAGYATADFVNYYRREGRAIWEQELALDQQSADSLLKFMRWNAQPENKFYRYDYYLDNCSTRARDALDLALHGALKRELAAEFPDVGVTWRKETLRQASAFPLIGFGMTFALGRRADATLTPWEEGFLPARLRDRVRSVRVGVDRHSLVRAERELNPPGPIVDAVNVPSYAKAAAATGMAILVFLVTIGGPNWNSIGQRRVLGAFGTAWHLSVGVAGLLVLVAGLFTKHTFMAANAYVLLGTPASLALVWFYARGLSVNASERTRRAALGLSAIAVVCACTATLLVAAVPSVSPADWAPVMFAAPVHLMLGLLLLLHDGRRANVGVPA